MSSADHQLDERGLARVDRRHLERLELLTRAAMPGLTWCYPGVRAAVDAGRPAGARPGELRDAYQAMCQATALDGGGIGSTLAAQRERARAKAVAALGAQVEEIEAEGWAVVSAVHRDRLEHLAAAGAVIIEAHRDLIEPSARQAQTLRALRIYRGGEDKPPGRPAELAHCGAWPPAPCPPAPLPEADG